MTATVIQLLPKTKRLSKKARAEAVTAAVARWIDCFGLGEWVIYTQQAEYALAEGSVATISLNHAYLYATLLYGNDIEVYADGGIEGAIRHEIVHVFLAPVLCAGDAIIDKSVSESIRKTVNAPWEVAGEQVTERLSRLLKRLED